MHARKQSPITSENAYGLAHNQLTAYSVNIQLTACAILRQNTGCFLKVVLYLIN